MKPDHESYIDVTKERLLSILKKEKGFIEENIIPRRKQNKAPLSFAQSRLWFLDQLIPENPFYNIPMTLGLKGLIDIYALSKALMEIIRRHESLRTRFVVIDEEPVQVIEDEVSLLTSLMDLRYLSEVDKKNETKRIAVEESILSFDLGRDLMLRSKLLIIDEENFTLLLSMHHIASDGWSLGIFQKELTELYSAYSKGEPSPLEDLPIQYADFAVWQRMWLRGEVLDNQLSYWRDQLSGLIPIKLPTKRKRPLIQSFRGNVLNFFIEPELTKKLKNISQENFVSLYMTLLAVFGVLLSFYSGHYDIAVGTPIANRNRKEVEGLIGFFINTLVMRIDLSGNPSFLELIGRVRKITLDAYSNQDLPFEKIVEELQPERDMSRNPLAQIMFALQNVPGSMFEIPDLAIDPIRTGAQTVKCDLDVTLWNAPDGLGGSFVYNTDLFDSATITRLMKHYSNLLEEIVANPEKSISELSIISEEESHQLLVEWNNTNSDYPDAKLIHEKIEDQVERTPDAVAVSFEDERITYLELDRKANQLARHLRNMGVAPDVITGILLDRSPEMVIAIIGVLKAGGAYVPFDRSHPSERLGFMLTDSEATVLLTRKDLISNLSEQNALKVIFIDRDWNFIKEECIENPGYGVAPGNLAYVMYTSGSTGKPKGVMIPHQGLSNYSTWASMAYELNSGQGSLVHSSFSFDLTITGLFLPLLTGGNVILVSEDESGESLSRYLEKDGGFSIIKVTPAHLELLAQLISSENARGSAKRFIIGGESLKGETLKFWQQHAPETKLVNEYGPTETVVGCCVYEIEKGESINGSAPIGRPIGNTQLYVLDSHFLPVPFLVSGELYIGGDGVGRGYLHRPDLTAERFIPNIFDHRGGARLYRSGDLACYRLDGNIDFNGRIDHQVKVRGYRIELGEIESVMSEHPGVRESVVIAREEQPGDKRLVAYIVPSNGVLPDAVEIKKYLKTKLPDYMIPWAFVMLDEMPLTPNGKVDRKVLPAPEGEVYARGVYEAPAGEVEEILSGIWSEVLNITPVGRNDNFFDLGGHSLLIVKVHRKIKKILKKEIKIVDLFTYPTIKLLSNYINPLVNQSQSIMKTMQIVKRSEQYEPIAIISMICRFPGIRNAEEFWQNLRDGKEIISRYTDEELLSDGVKPSLLENTAYVKVSALLEDIDLFDAEFFGFSPRIAEITDPQHRLFLECAHEALELAGYRGGAKKCRIGVFTGSGSNFYLNNIILNNLSILENIDPIQLIISNEKDFLSTLISYKLNLYGPSLNIQTACSTSLVATHVACQSLLNNECDIALAGGVSISSFKKRGYIYREGGIMSPDGHCRAFDSKANGTAPGAGVGIVALKRLKDALADGDPIEAVIKGSAINNDGSLKVGFTAPSVDGQAEVIREAQAAAGIKADTISYIEAHGTGTILGDPIEIKALTQAFHEDTDRKGFCAIGSVKTNIGHTDTAAGVAGLIKTVLALKHKKIPASLNFRAPNPEIDFENSPFYVNTELREWKSNSNPRRAGVSSFGIGGTNAHVIVEEAPSLTDENPEPETTFRPYHLISLSAKTSSALDSMSDNLVKHLEKHSDLKIPDVAYSLHMGRKSFDHRRILVCRDSGEALDFLREGDSERIVTGYKEEGNQRTVFMFPGQGAQYVNMCLDLYRDEQAFRNDIDFYSELLEPQLDFDLRKIIFPVDGELSEVSEQLKQTAITQPALFVIEYALARLFISWGITPSAMIGHSIGEYVAACLSGVFSLEDCLMLVTLRGKLIQNLPEGNMLAVPLSEGKLNPLLGNGLSIAAVNSTSLCTVSGHCEAIRSFKEIMDRKGVSCIALQTSHAFHSTMMEPILKEYTDHVRKIDRNPPRIPFISNVTGTWITEKDAMDPDYWARHIRHTVRFADGMSELLKAEDQILLEVGPGRTLKTLALQNSDLKAKQTILSSVRHSRETISDISFLLTTLGRLWVEGVKVDWSEFYRNEKHRRVPLPTYPFERQRYWIDAKPVSVEAFKPKDDLMKKKDITDWFYEPIWEVSNLASFSKGDDTDELESCWMVFVDDLEIGDGLIKGLKQQGQKIITVNTGDSFVKVNNDAFYINPGSRDDYVSLINAFKSNGISINRIVHLWSVTGNGHKNSGIGDNSRIHELGFYSLIYLAQAIGESGLNNTLQIDVISNGIHAIIGKEQLCPEKSTLLGPVKVIPLEYPNIKCRSIDIVVDKIEETDDWRFIVEQLLKEVISSAKDSIVAYRVSDRWVQTFKSIQLKKTKEIPRLKKRGVYLITGGLGGIGLSIAEYLAETVQARIILIGRSVLPDKKEWAQLLEQNNEESEDIKKIKKLRKLEEAGAEIFIGSADVSDLNQMEEVIKKAEEQFGEILGIIHSAGIAGGGMIQLKKVEEAEKVLSPKVKGTRVLEYLMKDRKLEFFILCSSGTSIMGGVGQVDYCAANIFLDAFAFYKNTKGDILTQSINWDAWQEVGMAVETEIPGYKQKARIEYLQQYGILPEEGIDAFSRILCSNSPQIIVSTLKLNLKQAPKLSFMLEVVDDIKIKPPKHPRPKQKIEYIPPVNDIEAKIVGIWQELLGIEEVGVKDNFFELGGDSLLLIKVHNKLKDILSKDISIADLFKYPNIKLLALYIVQGDKSSSAKNGSVRVIKKPRQYEPIAIIGMACRFSGSRNVEAFWQNIHNGVETISHFSDEYLLLTGVDHNLLTRSEFVKSGFVVEDIELFDAGFFNVSPREAEISDPQRRLFLECAHEVLEYSGYTSDFGRNRIGLFAGQGESGYIRKFTSNPDIISATDPFNVALANNHGLLSTYVSYKLNLNGPSLNIQTACSTSLVATHVACQSLLNNECDIALAGGVTINTFFKDGYLYQKGGITSPDGHCRAFDSKANGTAPGAGVGIVALKRLKDALADGDPIEAVIKGSAINNDGSLKVGFTAPSVDGQAEVIREAQAAAGIKADTISYIEAHGTGTILGDPIEIKALTQAFHEDTDRKGFCAIGSVKTNIGHTDTAAGVAGLIKTVLALKHKKIPASLNFRAPNPEIDFENSPFYVNTELREWKSNSNPRRAGVSSFGIGGTNAHVIVEEAPSLTDENPEPETTFRPYHLISLSAKTSSALDSMSDNLVKHLEKHSDLKIPDVAYSLHMGRKSFDHRRILVCRDSGEALDFLREGDSERIVTGYKEEGNQRTVFMFPGQGAQYVNMCLDLYRDEQAFRNDIDFYSELLEPQLDFDLRKIIFPVDGELSEVSEQLKQTAITQPALFVIEYALARLFISWGITPSAMIGHSIGEYVAACLSGVFSLEDCLMLVTLRGKLIQNLPEGNMLAVPLSEGKLNPLLGNGLSIAAVNSTSLCTVSGHCEAIRSFKEIMDRKGVSCIALQTSHAFHSTMMEPILKEYTDHVRKIDRNPPRIPFISNVTGTWITEKDAMDPDYWARHIRHTVRFADGMSELLKAEDQILLEVGPGRTLKTLALQNSDLKAKQTILSSVRHSRETISDISFLLTTLGRLWVEGVKVDWSEFYRNEKHRRVPLPTYPFERQRYWIDAKPVSVEAFKPKDDLMKKKDITDWFYEPIWEVSNLASFSKGDDTDELESCWMVFVDDLEIGDGLIKGLKQQGQKIITVNTGDSFVKVNNDAFYINPGSRDDYVSLINAFKSNGISINRIVHLWSVTGNGHKNSGIGDNSRIHELGFYSLIYLAQAIGESGLNNTLQIDVISNGIHAIIGKEQLCPEKSTLLGPVKVIPLEYPNIKCRSIDIVVDKIEETDDWRFIVEQLLKEVISSAKDSIVAYRVSDRWVQTFKSIQLKKTKEIPRLKKRGVYLITGGLGGIGLSIAEYLAETVQARIILIGRSVLPDKKEWAQLLEQNNEESEDIKKIKKLRKLEEAGAEIFIGSADVSDLNQMEEVIKKAEEQFGEILGIIHSAGIAGGGMIQLKKVEEAEKVLSPKVKGTRVLEYLMKDRKLEFFILCSSGTSIMGGVGQVDYCAANIFLDAFAFYKNTKGDILTQSINWDAWQEVGMAVETEIPGYKQKARIEYLQQYGILPEEGIDAFSRILCSNSPQIIVSTLNLKDVQRYDISLALNAINRENFKRQRYVRPALSTLYIEPVSETEKTIADIWQQLLGINKIGINDNFFELGGDSLLALQTMNKLHDVFGIELPLITLLEKPTIESLAINIMEIYSEVLEVEEMDIRIGKLNKT